MSHREKENKETNYVLTKCDVVYEWGRGVKERHEWRSGRCDCWQHLHEWFLKSGEERKVSRWENEFEMIEIKKKRLK